MAVGIARMLRDPVPSDADSFVRERLRNRERSFVETLSRAVFSRPDHPYSVMFRIAGCEPGDLVKQIGRDGLEATLLQLRRAGVFLTHDEWKGATPIVRSGREIPHALTDFRNPLINGWVDSSSSGSSGSPVTTARATALYTHLSAYARLRAREFGVPPRVEIHVQPILPFAGGLITALRGHRIGLPVDRWFTEGSRLADTHYRSATRALIWIGNRLGARAPYPVYLPERDFSPVAAHIARYRTAGRPCVVYGIASALVRVAAAAIERQLDISGTLFFCFGEALTSGKQGVFSRACARGVAGYMISEVGHIGIACSAARGDQMHLLQDTVALIAYRRPAPYADDVEVNSLHFTTLLPYASNIFVNIEVDDEGDVEPATCECVYSRLGLTTLVRQVTSFGKVSPQGMTFHGSDLVHVLEEALPARLGGRPGDYQLVEREGASGQTEIRLHVSPRIGVTDARLVRETFLDLMRSQWGGALATRLWINAGAVEVAFAEPIATHTGKVHPVRLLNAGGPHTTNRA